MRDEVFVAMSFAPEFSSAWTQIIQPAIAQTGLSANRVDTSRVGNSILTEIMDGIAHARVVLAEVSTMTSGQRNANVMYEVGLAHATRLPEEVILLRQDGDRIPFDFSHIRVFRYDLSDINASVAFVSSLIQDSLKEIELVKGLRVEEAAAGLDPWSIKLILEHIAEESFDVPYPKNMGEALANFPTPSAMQKLLQLRIIRLDLASGGPYRWTEFGRLVQAKMLNITPEQLRLQIRAQGAASKLSFCPMAPSTGQT